MNIKGTYTIIRHPWDVRVVIIRGLGLDVDAEDGSAGDHFKTETPLERGLSAIFQEGSHNLVEHQKRGQRTKNFI